MTTKSTKQNTKSTNTLCGSDHSFSIYDEKTFQEQAETAKKNCPVSQALSGVEIQLQARLIN